MTRTVLDRLQSLLVALSLAFLVWMYANGRERWTRRAHEDALGEPNPPTNVEKLHDASKLDNPSHQP
jgi:hypothetical protein